MKTHTLQPGLGRSYFKSAMIDLAKCNYHNLWNQMNRNHEGMNISFNQEVILDSFMKNTEKILSSEPGHWLKKQLSKFS